MTLTITTTIIIIRPKLYFGPYIFEVTVNLVSIFW